MTDSDTELEKLLSEEPLQPPDGFALKVMLKVGDTPQASKVLAGPTLAFSVDEETADKSNKFEVTKGRLYVQLIKTRGIDRALQFVRWAALAAGGALGIEQSLAFLVGAWTVRAAF